MSEIENWKVMSDISDEDEQCEFIRTGIKKLDQSIQGLILGATSIWTGTNGSNKSGTIGQIALNVIDSKQCKVAIFSGELPDKRFKRWLYIQASGKDHNVKKTNGFGEEIDFYETPLPIKQKITTWLDDWLYLYDNKVGFEIEQVGNSIVELLKKDDKVKLVFIDNLFVLGIGKLSADKWEAQKQLVLRMTRIAQQYNVHIGFICHPTKLKSLIRKEDVSGSSDITNCADNVFILHRNTADFKSRSKEFFGWTDDHPIYQYDNQIEVAKDRENGAIENFIGLYYEKESKRILNYKGENYHYGWEEKPKQSRIELTEVDTDDELFGRPF
jgi:replicative DNA helicase